MVSFNGIFEIIILIFYKIFCMSIKASILGIIIFLIQKILKNKIHPQIKYLMYILFCVVLIFPIELNIENKILSYPVELFSVFSENNLKNIFGINQAENINTNLLLDKNIENNSINYNIDLNSIISILYLLVTFIVLIIYIISYEVFNNKTNDTVKSNELFILEKCKLKLHIKRKVKLVYKDNIKVPSLFGIINLKILVNKNIKELTDKELEYIFMHELIHYKRKDNIVNIFMITLKTIYFFNPIIWILLNELKNCMEMVVDNEVTSKLDEEDKKIYCRLLVNLASQSDKLKLEKSVAFTDCKMLIKDRIIFIKTSFNNFRFNVFIFILCFIIIIVSILFIFNKKDNNLEFNRIKELVNNSCELVSGYSFDLLKVEKNNEEFYTFDDYELNINNYIYLLEKVDNKNLFYEYNGTEEIDDIECIVITIYSRSNTEYVGWELYIDSKNGFVIQEKYYCNSENNKKPQEPYSELHYSYTKKEN